MSYRWNRSWYSPVYRMMAPDLTPQPPLPQERGSQNGSLDATSMRLYSAMQTPNRNSDGRCSHSRLHVVQVGVDAVARDQFGVRPLLGDASVGQHDDALRVADGRESVGDDQHRAVVSQRLQRILHRLLAFVVQRARRLVEDDDRRVFQED